MNEQTWDEILDVFMRLVVLALFGLMLWWSWLGPKLGFEHHPGRACAAGIIGFVLGMSISIGDDGGLGEEMP